MGFSLVVALETYKIAYVPIPKAACTSVKLAMAELDPNLDVSGLDKTDSLTFIHKSFPTVRFRPERWHKYDGWTRFTVIRDPLKRLLSGYSDRVLQKQDLVKSRKTRKAGLPTLPDPDFFFQNLAAYQENSSAIKHHSLGTEIFIGSDLSIYDHIYKMKQTKQLAAHLSEVAGQKVEIPHWNSSSQKLRLADLAKKTREGLMDYLRRDYDLLADYYNNPM
ncbi:MAG: sulfotransferase family protein [Rhodobacteraceae bacterium]|nr:sulfotransferase family protein [Paracoccaceae bacterium]